MCFEWLAPLPVPAFFARPGQGAIQSDPVKPRSYRRITTEARDGVPYLGNNFLEKIIAIVSGEGIGMDDFEKHVFMLAYPPIEDLFPLLLIHVAIHDFTGVPDLSHVGISLTQPSACSSSVPVSDEKGQLSYKLENQFSRLIS